MTEHPIIFSGDMIRALLAGRKSVTRRLSKKWLKVKRGDRLWVRETLNILDWDDSEARLGVCVQYAADDLVRGWTHDEDPKFKVSMDWGKPRVAPTEYPLTKPIRVVPCIHMPRWASRITLEATEDAREEPLQDITCADVLGEGSPVRPREYSDGSIGCVSATSWFRSLWDSLHKDAPWASNPTVVRLAFKVLP